MSQNPPEDGQNRKEMTPLERYLSKQQQENPQEEKPSQEASSSSASQASVGHDGQAQVDDDQAIEKGAPALPPLPRKIQDSKGFGEPIDLKDYRPAGFWVRFFAVVIDGIVLAAINWLVRGVFGDVFGALISFVVTFFYFGWFYSEKGASPGKMVFDLQVVNAHSLQRVGYLRAFGRETIGRTLSSIALFIGYFIALFRKDRRALHDLIFDTRVVQSIKANEEE